MFGEVSVVEMDRSIKKRLSGLVSQWLRDKGFRATTAKKWYKFRNQYWWNYFLVSGVWCRFEIDGNDSVSGEAYFLAKKKTGRKDNAK